MTAIDVRWVGLEAARARIAATPKMIDRAAVQALNRAITSVRALAVREIRKEVQLPAGYVREKLRINRATASRPEASIVASRRGVLLTRFPHRVLKRGGIAVTVTPGSRALFSRAFLIKSLRGSGVPGIAVRKGKARLPVAVLHGPSPSQVFGTIRKDIAPEAGQIYRRQFQSALLFMLSKS